MKTYFLDTSIFVAAFWKAHPNFESSFGLLSKSKNIHFISSHHSLVEYYSVMSRLPVSVRVEPSLIYNIIQENILPHVKIFSLSSKEYIQFLKQASLLQIQGGNIHDFYHYRVAQKMKVNALFTWNTKDFIQFGTELSIQTP